MAIFATMPNMRLANFSLIEIGDQPDFFKLKQTEFGVIWG